MTIKELVQTIVKELKLHSRDSDLVEVYEDSQDEVCIQLTFGRDDQEIFNLACWIRKHDLHVCWGDPVGGAMNCLYGAYHKFGDGCLRPEAEVRHILELWKECREIG